LTEITSLNAAPPNIDGTVFGIVTISNITLSVPARAVKDYKMQWGGFKRYIPLYASGEVFGISFVQPAAFTNSEPKDVNYTTDYYVHSITAVNVPHGWTVTPNVNDDKIEVTAPANDGNPYTASGTATLLVSDGAERTITKPLALECPPYTPPEAFGISFTQPTGFAQGSNQDIPFTLTGNVSLVQVTNVPQGWTVDVSRNGNAGTFTVRVPAPIESNDEGGAAMVFVFGADGRFLTHSLLLPTTPLHAASSRVWKFDGRTWSDAIQNPDCRKEDFTNPACRSFTEHERTYYYYTWGYVSGNSAICHDPWRVPTKVDFQELVQHTDVNTLTNEWGLGGIVDVHGGVMEVESNGYWWAAAQPWALKYHKAGTVEVIGVTLGEGLQLRCVK
jgi:hypothetical protein